jgi:hypothetical protein
MLTQKKEDRPSKNISKDLFKISKLSIFVSEIFSTFELKIKYG